MINKRLIPKMGYCLATDMVAKDKMKIMFMYREAPDQQDDSGWRFFSGYETDGYVNNPDNIGIYDVNTIAEIDPSIIKYLQSPLGTALERSDIESEFTEVKDFFSE